MKRYAVGILIFDGVEVLDFAGPYEVFSRTRLEPGPASRRSDESAPFRVCTIAKAAAAVVATGGLRVLPDFTWSSAPDIDILVIPGGFGTRPLLEDAPTLEWIRSQASRVRQVASVCTGSLLLARAGLLKGQRATTHWAAYDLLTSLDPTIQLMRTERVVHDKVVSSAGVSAGIDMAFDLVEQLCGREVADETARYIEYPREQQGPGPGPDQGQGQGQGRRPGSDPGPGPRSGPRP